MSTVAQPKHPDCWYGVEDAAERKKIQNRLAQRARRRRKAGLPAPDCPGRTSLSSSQSSNEISPGAEWSLTIERGSPFSSMAAAQISSEMVPSGSAFSAEIPSSVFAALWDNGAMMGLKCSTVVPAKSLPMGDHIPDSLQPTLLQLTTIHPIWIDRFPFPKMRDNLITLSGGYDEEEFLRDLFSMDSFTVVQGKAGWDPSAWAVGEGFGRKWGFLFQ